MSALELFLSSLASILALVLALSLASPLWAVPQDDACDVKNKNSLFQKTEILSTLSDGETQESSVVSEAFEKDELVLGCSTSTPAFTEFNPNKPATWISSNQFNRFLNWFSSALGAIGSPV